MDIEYHIPENNSLKKFEGLEVLRDENMYLTSSSCNIIFSLYVYSILG